MTLRPFKDKKPRLGTGVYVDEAAVVIGDVRLGDHVSVWPTTVIRGDVAAILIGNNTNVQDGCVLHVSHANTSSDKPQDHPLKIGEGVTLGHKAIVHACTVGNYCLIGMGAIILDDAIIEDYVMVGAAALVPSGKLLESGYLYLGAPAKKIRALSDQEKTQLEYSAQHYINLKNQYL
ncbi:MAG: gamma carbonic anhydrase family protein [Methylococcales bacterium]|nr:gamma carbonic anhydrase family protein [Methylococcales bacterium]